MSGDLLLKVSGRVLLRSVWIYSDR